MQTRTNLAQHVSAAGDQNCLDTNLREQGIPLTSIAYVCMHRVAYGTYHTDNQ